MALTPGVMLVTADTPSVSTILDGIVQLHCACILNDNTMATFMPPLNHPQIYKWWEDRIAEVTSGHRHIIVYLTEVNDRTTLTNAKGQDIRIPFSEEGKPWPIIPAAEEASPSGDGDLEIGGLVSLVTPTTQTGPFRGLVEKLFTSPFHRQKGIARIVMKRLEEVAWDLGRWSILLDTTAGTPAEQVYPRLGYKQVWYIPQRGFSPEDRSLLLDEVGFFKDLRHDKRL
ncbi:hypothetical protein LTR84_011268 [Exophiala bonariae]|uniref:N-acetyltransferase domain-containing protein n=1 Tax=Exophiala bonariae TaxID=1690606 RepID=A0AAV9MVA7_9EURO|nr:hypothetical protein LTR84_011268 [Exophiala bonariae]